MINKVKYIASALIENATTAIFIKTHPRDKRIVIFGAWMGQRFADNSRFLFQYLSENKKTLNLSHVVWITRSRKVYQEVKYLNYEVIMAGTPNAKKWQLKGGIHIICNNAGYGTYPPDMDVKYSWGAKKIQLWHGVGFKAVGSSSNKAKGHEWYRRIVNKNRKLKCLISAGGWSECNILSTSTFDQNVMIKSQNSYEDRVFISSYPRYCDCLALTAEEQNVIQEINQYQYVLIYLPTFRDNNNSYIHPLKNKTTQKFLLDNNILWIEKQHSVSNYNDQEFAHIPNVKLLDSEFDVNVLYNHVNIILSDYSSTVCDGIYKKIPTIMYIPDLLDFQNGSGGLLLNIGDYFKPIIAMNIDELLGIINECKKGNYWSEERIELFSKARELFYNNINASYESIWRDINNLRD